jgi:hypothetical protein
LIVCTLVRCSICSFKGMEAFLLNRSSQELVSLRLLERHFLAWRWI